MKKIISINEPIRMLEAKHGCIAYNSNCHYMGRAIELYGEYCEGEISFFENIIKPTDIVWEVGSNIGAHTIALSKIAQKGKVYAFEPQTSIFQLLCANIAINNIRNTRCFNLALGEQDGYIKIPKVDYDAYSNFGAVSLIGVQELSEEISEIKRIDSLKHLAPPSFIKIDVEGMELMVIKGAQDAISKARPSMYIENDRPLSSSALIQSLWQLNYELYWHITPYFSANNHFKNNRNIYVNEFSFNMIALPEEKKIEIQGLEKITDLDWHPLASRN